MKGTTCPADGFYQRWAQASTSKMTGRKAKGALYNRSMRKLAAAVILAVLLWANLIQMARAQTEEPTPEVTAQDLISAVNTIRVGLGLPALVVHPILMQVAQDTATTMALNEMTGHIGGVKDRVWAAGYGVMDTPWATENFAMGPASIDDIMMMWADELHMNPMADARYYHIGAGVAETNGTVYYIVIAAYTDRHPGPAYTPGTAVPARSGTPAAADLASQYIFAVVTATPQDNGKLVHTVRQGQSLWAIAMAYGVKIQAILAANGLSADFPTIYTGQKLRIPLTLPSRTPPPKETAAATAPRVTAAAHTPTPPQVPTPQAAALAAASPEEEAAKTNPQAAILYVIEGFVVLGVVLIGWGMVTRRRG